MEITTLYNMVTLTPHQNQPNTQYPVGNTLATRDISRNKSCEITSTVGHPTPRVWQGKPKMASCGIYEGYKEGIFADRSIALERFPHSIQYIYYSEQKLDISRIYSFLLS